MFLDIRSDKYDWCMGCYDKWHNHIASCERNLLQGVEYKGLLVLYQQVVVCVVWFAVAHHRFNMGAGRQIGGYVRFAAGRV